VRALPPSRRGLVRLLDGVGTGGKLPHLDAVASSRTLDYAAEAQALRTFPLRWM